MNASPLAALLNFLPALNYLQRGKWILGRYFAHDPAETWGKGDPSQLNLFHDRYYKFAKSSCEILRKKVCHSLYVGGTCFFPERLKSVWKKSILIPIMDQIPCNFLCKTPQTNPCRLYWVKVWREMNVYWILWWHSIASRKDVELGKQILGRNVAHYGHGDRLHFNLA